MKLSELINKVGDENVEIQNLDSCVSSMNMDAKGNVIATFGTQAKIAMNGFEKLGMVIWMDREAVKQAMAGKGPDTQEGTEDV